MGFTILKFGSTQYRKIENAFSESYKSEWKGFVLTMGLLRRGSDHTDTVLSSEAVSNYDSTHIHTDIHTSTQRVGEKGSNSTVDPDH